MHTKGGRRARARILELAILICFTCPFPPPDPRDDRGPSTLFVPGSSGDAYWGVPIDLGCYDFSQSRVKFPIARRRNCSGEIRAISIEP